MGTTEEHLARWIAETSLEGIPPEAVRVVEEAVFDQIGVTLAGSVQPVGRIILQHGREAGGAPEATVIGGAYRTTVEQAALVNGTCGHALDYDDVGGWGHPTTVLLPAVLAVGEKVAASGRAIVEAYIVGFEVAHALYRSGRYNQMLRGFHSTAVFGTMGAAAAAAKILRLPPQQIVMALGIAGSMGAGIVQNFGTMVKPLHAGLAARNGVTAALLARRGMVATAHVVEGRAGWAHAYFGEDAYDPTALVRELGNPFRVQEVIAYKKYPCCYANHSMLDGLLGVLGKNGIRYEDIDSVEVEQSYLSVVMLYDRPATGLEGKFSIRYNAAVAIREGTPGIKHFTDEKVKDPALQEAMDKVRIVVRPKWAIGAGELREPTPVTVRLKDGRVFRAAVPWPQVAGTQQNPWNEEGLRGKFMANASLALPRERAEEAARVWRHISTVTDIRGAMALLATDGA
jgi:2-methylcitrate dehydratase PrpD